MLALIQYEVLVIYFIVSSFKKMLRTCLYHGYSFPGKLDSFFSFLIEDGRDGHKGNNNMYPLLRKTSLITVVKGIPSRVTSLVK